MTRAPGRSATVTYQRSPEAGRGPANRAGDSKGGVCPTSPFSCRVRGDGVHAVAAPESVQPAGSESRRPPCWMAAAESRASSSPGKRASRSSRRRESRFSRP
jgi:hypothetical protein